MEHVQPRGIRADLFNALFRLIDSSKALRQTTVSVRDATNCVFFLLPYCTKRRAHRFAFHTRESCDAGVTFLNVLNAVFLCYYDRCAMLLPDLRADLFVAYEVTPALVSSQPSPHMPHFVTPAL